MTRRSRNSFLERRDRVWWHVRRVPGRVAHIDSRGRVRETLSTTSIEEARYKRDLLADAGLPEDRCASRRGHWLKHIVFLHQGRLEAASVTAKKTPPAGLQQPHLSPSKPICAIAWI